MGPKREGANLDTYSRRSYPKGLCGWKKELTRGVESSEVQGTKAEYTNKDFSHIKGNATHAEGTDARS